MAKEINNPQLHIKTGKPKKKKNIQTTAESMLCTNEFIQGYCLLYNKC